MKNIIIYLWGIYPVIFIRKVMNTFRSIVWLTGQFYDRNKKIKKDSAQWETEEYYKSDSYSAIQNEREKRFVNYIVGNTEKQDRILDICCNQGRFLFELKRRGYSSLFGFDIMGAAINKLKRSPEYLPDIIKVEHAQAQNYFNNKKDLSYDWAIAYPATIELINPEFDIFSELGRTVKKGMFLAISENGHAYPRFYRLLHKMNGFEICSVTPLIDHENQILSRLIHSVKRNTDG